MMIKSPKIREQIPKMRTGYYISPSKKRIAFDFVGDFEFSQNKKVAMQEVPLSNSWVVQDLGVGMLTFSLKMVFSGWMADKHCEQMINAMSESGSGMLLHPYGQNILCIPTGWKHSPSNITSIRVAKLSVTFVKTLKQAFPSMQKDFEGDIELEKATMFGLNSSITEMLYNSTFQYVTSFKKWTEIGIRAVVYPFEQISDLTSEANNLLMQAKLEIQNFFDLDAPVLSITKSVGTMIALLKDFKINIKHKKKAYKDALEAIWPTKSKNKDTDVDTTQAMDANPQAEWNLCKILAISQFFSFKNCINLNSLQIVEFMKDNIAVYNRFLTQKNPLEEEDLIQLLKALRLSLGACQDMLEKYPKCKTFTIKKDTNIVTLAFELYGNPEDAEKILEHNNLTIAETFLLPKGKEVVYFG